MTSRSKPPDRNASEPPSAAAGSTLRVTSEPGQSRERLLAELGYSAVLPNVTTANAFLKGIAGEMDLTESVAVMCEKAKAASAGNLTDLETMLAAQAVALNAVFNEMARRASVNMGEYLNATEVYLRLAFKAQAQCRATAQTLFEMKNPQSVAFVKQANISNGPQQVNNGVSSDRAPMVRPRAETLASRSNEVLGVAHEQRLDTGTTGAAVSADPGLETVGAFYRTAD